MTVGEHRKEAGRPRLAFVVLTVSDTRSAATDRSGSRLAELVEAAGHGVAGRSIVRDEVEAIRAAARAALDDPAVDVVLTTGGTGVAPRDVTPEAIAPLLERELPGFGERFRALSWERIGAAAMLSRALGGVARGKAVFVLPGAPDALELALRELVLPELAHLLAQARRA
jgi:molybdenum cofactor biosynthesis protein B